MILTKSFVPTRYQSKNTGHGYNPIFGFVGKVPFYQNEYEFLLERLPEDYQKIKEWVEKELMPYMTRKSINELHHSYGLKHVAEKQIGFYVSNGDIKLALMEEGVPFKAYYRDPYVSYPLSERFYRDRMRRDDVDNYALLRYNNAKYAAQHANDAKKNTK